MQATYTRQAGQERALRVLLVTSEWPTPAHPGRASFIVQQVKFLRQAGVQLDVFAFRGAKHPLRYAYAWAEVARILRRAKYDVIHAHFGQSGLVAWHPPIPLVVTFHGSDLIGIYGPDGRYTRSGRVLRQISQLSARLASEVILVAPHLATYLPPGLGYQVIPGGLDFGRFRPVRRDLARAALGLPMGQRLILFAGDPAVAVKRYALAQQAVQQLDDARVSMIVVRDMPHAAMPLYMSACDVLLLTSSHEGSPTVVKEALACNLPVVSVDVGDVRERIGAIPGCVLCADDQPATIAAGLSAVFSWPEPFHGREAAQDLDEQLLVQRIIDLYRRAGHAARPFRAL